MLQYVVPILLIDGTPDMKGPSSHSHADFILQYHFVCYDSADDRTKVGIVIITIY